jgi:hypothetical protein
VTSETILDGLILVDSADYGIAQPDMPLLVECGLPPPPHAPFLIFKLNFHTRSNVFSDKRCIYEIVTGKWYEGEHFNLLYPLEFPTQKELTEMMNKYVNSI